MVIVMTVIIVTMIVMRMRRMGIGMTVVAMTMVAVAMRVVHVVAAGVATMRTREGDGAGDQRTDQRQEYESLDHEWLSPSSD
jgi:hypothetical protein